MKKVLWSIAAATLIITLAGCSNTVEPIQAENRQLLPVTETVPEPVGPIEDEGVVLSAGSDQFVDTITSKEETEPEPQKEVPVISQPQESVPQASVKASITFVTDVQKETSESSNPAPSESTQEPEMESTQSPAPPAESEPPVEPAPPAVREPAEPAFCIDYWISYAKEYAESLGLNLDTTAVDCWDNPITAGEHCTYLERDIQNRLNRYAKDKSILNVWVWAESHSDGSYDLYIGYA